MAFYRDASTDGTAALAGEVVYLLERSIVETQPVGIEVKRSFDVDFRRWMRRAVIAGMVMERRRTAGGWTRRPCAFCDDGADLEGMSCGRCDGVGTLMIPDAVRLEMRAELAER